MDKVYSIFDDSLLHGSESKNFLSIELSPGGFSYAILDTERFEYIALESFDFGYPLDHNNIALAAEYIIQSNDILKGEFQKVSIAYVSPQFILIPEELYLDTERNTIVDFNIDIDESEFAVNVDMLNNLNARSLYPAPKAIINMINEHYPINHFRHYSTPLIEAIMYNVLTYNNNSDIILHLNNGFFEIIVIENGTIKIIKAFSFVTYDDLMYYVFYTLENMGMDAENLDLLIIGNVSIESELYKNIKLYFRSVEFGNRNDLYKYSDDFDNIPHHYFYTLLNLNICG